MRKVGKGNEIAAAVAAAVAAVEGSVYEPATVRGGLAWGRV